MSQDWTHTSSKDPEPDDLELHEAALLTIVLWTADFFLRQILKLGHNLLPEPIEPILLILVPIRLMLAFTAFAALVWTLFLLFN